VHLHGAHPELRRVADDLRVALLTEIGPAVDPSTARPDRRSSEDSLGTPPPRRGGVVSGVAV